MVSISRRTDEPPSFARGLFKGPVQVTASCKGPSGRTVASTIILNLRQKIYRVAWGTGGQKKVVVAAGGKTAI